MLPEVTDFCRLVFLRSPELTPADAARAIGDGPGELSRRGRQRAVEWGAVLQDEQLDVVLAADVPQCRMPAEVLASSRGLVVTTEPRLLDQNLGTWQGRPWEELVAEDPERVKQFFEEFAGAQAPDGESLAQAVERLISWWRDMSPQGAGKTIALVTAGAMISGFVAAMLGMRLGRCFSLNLPHGGIGVLDIFGNGARLTAWNLDGHAR